MITNQRKMMTATRTSQWRRQQPKTKTKTKEHQSEGETFQKTWKYQSRVGIKTRKMKDLEELMFSDQVALLGFQVASNDLILKKMMAEMTLVTLKTARLVSKEWKKLANFELERRKCARMLLKYDWHSKLSSVRNLDDISWMEYDLKYFGSRTEEDLNKFARFCAHKIKMLKLPASDSAWDILHAGAGKFPNLEILRFHQCSTTDLSEKFNNESSRDLILQNLPKLKRIEGVLLADTSSFSSKFLVDKAHLIKSAKLNGDSWETCCCCTGDTALEKTTALAQGKPKLEKFAILIDKIRRDLIPELIQQIDLIFEFSQESLRILKMSFPFVSRLHFEPQLFLKGQLGGKSFPNLKTVKIELDFWMPLYLPDSLTLDNFPTDRGQLTSVVNLELQCQHRYGSTRQFLPAKWFPWLAILFPNVQNLTTENWKNGDEVLRHVFVEWPKLTSLAIQVFSNDVDTCVKMDLDPVFTGLSVEKCQELRMNPEEIGILTDRTWPNLQSLKELKRLDIILNKSWYYPLWCPVSPVSFLCAVNLRPELKTTIRLPEKAKDVREFLEPLAPYARIEDFSGTPWKF